MNKKTSQTADPHASREARVYEHPIVSREFILQSVRDYGKPCTLNKLCKLLEMNSDYQRQALERRLGAMVRDGQLLLNRRGSYLSVNEKDLVHGTVLGHADGFGFLRRDEGGEDYFIAPGQMRSLLHGDRVIMRPKGKNARGRIEVSLIEVLQRANHEVVGRLVKESNINYVVPENKALHQDIVIMAEDLSSAKHGQIVLVDIVEQPSRHHPPIGRIRKTLGDHMAPGMEVQVAVYAHGVPYEWPTQVDQQVTGLPDKVLADEVQGRLDLRQLPLITIDGADSKDFDDAVYCEPSVNGYRLWVAIADVAHYVQQDTPIDEEAFNRGTSVYFANQVIPMLPEALSNELCSLNPNVDRLCMVCEMHLDKQGELQSYAFHEAVMHSHARLTYDKVAVLLGLQEEAEQAALMTEYAEILPHLYHLYALFQCRRQCRQVRGAVDFDTTETQIIFGDDCRIETIVARQRNDAHRLIEECMILANIAAAKFVAKHKIPALYRVHAEPPKDKLEDLRQFLRELGLDFPATEPEAADYQRVLANIAEREDQHLIQTVLLRSMSQAVYTPLNEGHFGLALEYYAHFTSPIRRYPDLMVHRAIRHCLRGGSTETYTYTGQAMQSVGEHCSMVERRADDATRDAESWLKCEYIAGKLGQQFNGVISGVTGFGLFVELEGIYVEGLVHVTSLKKDYYVYDPVHHRLEGENSRRRYRLGDCIMVLVAAVNLEERKIDFEIVE